MLFRYFLWSFRAVFWSTIFCKSEEHVPLGSFDFEIQSSYKFDAMYHFITIIRSILFFQVSRSCKQKGDKRTDIVVQDIEGWVPFIHKENGNVPTESV